MGVLVEVYRCDSFATGTIAWDTSLTITTSRELGDRDMTSSNNTASGLIHKTHIEVTETLRTCRIHVS